ncbi:MAG TPA: hypothetical protein VHB50_08075 [Bryobacteraceae bacterium]|nr:hypothetical protein [Bryobacteraceae bacterium]
MKRRDLLALAPAVLATGCSTPSPKAPPKPAEPVTGLHALYQMYQRARTWAQDLKVIRCQSINLTQVKAVPDKAPAWQGVFASDALGQKRAYTFSVIDASITMRSGIFPDAPGPWSNDNRAFLLAAAKIDTDEAWKTAMKHGEEYSKKNPDMPITWTLEMGRNINDPVWRAIWGDSPTSSAFSVLIDASTGLYLATLH